MIPRYQRVLFWILVGGIILMAVVLVYEQRKNRDKFTANDDATPISAPATADAENMMYAVANDADGTITDMERQVALPETPTVRARALLEHLLAEYSLPESRHPLASGPAVDDVFFLTMPVGGSAAAGFDADNGASGGQLAVINLRGTFCSSHPSGVMVETLTINSIIGTLHNAFPQIERVRFLVDGQPHDTLAGHADLHRTYAAVDTANKAAQPVAEDDSSQP